MTGENMLSVTDFNCRLGQCYFSNVNEYENGND